MKFKIEKKNQNCMLPLHTFIEGTKPGLKDNMIGSVFMM